MINVEDFLFNKIIECVELEFPQTIFFSDYVSDVPTFPCVMLQQINSQTYTRSQDSENIENHEILQYQVDIFATGVNKKQECREIAGLVDSVFLRYGFSRVLLRPIPNMLDINIYRIVARYDAIVGKNNIVYSMK